MAPLSPHKNVEAFKQFVHNGWHGRMNWLEETLGSRLNAQSLFPGARSAVLAAMPYYLPEPSQPAEATPQSTRMLRIARFAWLRDYHKELKHRLHRVADWLREREHGCITQTCVDSAPIDERALAADSGLGWIGKNTLLLHPRFGSYLLLGAIVTNLDLPPAEPLADRCGSCTACLEACPTGALHPDRPYRMQANLCISYATIELRGSPLPDLPQQLAPHLQDWLFGCDICQDVCPYNRFAAPPPADWQAPLMLRRTRIPAQEILQWTESDRLAALAGTPAVRADLAQLQRNARASLLPGPLPAMVDSTPVRPFPAEPTPDSGG